MILALHTADECNTLVDQITREYWAKNEKVIEEAILDALCSPFGRGCIEVRYDHQGDIEVINRSERPK